MTAPKTKPEAQTLAPFGNLAIGGLPMKGKARAKGQAPEDFFAKATAKPSIMEPKLDGHRALIYFGGDEDVRLFAGSGREKSGKLPLVEQAVRDLKLPQHSWLDGEAVARTTGNGGYFIHDWGIVQSALGSGIGTVHPKAEEVMFVAFDVLALAGQDTRGLKFSDRRSLLDTIFEGNTDEGYARLSVGMEPSEKAVQKLIEQGYEGVMIKWLDSVYRSGARGPGWFKIKADDTADVIVAGYVPGKAALEGLIGAIEFSQYVGGELVYRGSCSGMDMAERRDITENQDAYIGRCFEIGYFGRTDDSYRSPQWKRWRDDKLPKDCTDDGGEG